MRPLCVCRGKTDCAIQKGSNFNCMIIAQNNTHSKKKFNLRHFSVLCENDVPVCVCAVQIALGGMGRLRNEMAAGKSLGCLEEPGRPRAKMTV